MGQWYIQCGKGRLQSWILHQKGDYEVPSPSPAVEVASLASSDEENHGLLEGLVSLAGPRPGLCKRLEQFVGHQCSAVPRSTPGDVAHGSTVDEQLEQGQPVHFVVHPEEGDLQ